MTAIKKWNNVVDLHRPNYTRKLKNADAVMSTIRWEMHMHDPNVLAAKVGVSLGCIYQIRNGKTKWPRPKTFFGLIDHLGLTMKLEKK